MKNLLSILGVLFLFLLLTAVGYFVYIVWSLHNLPPSGLPTMPSRVLDL